MTNADNKIPFIGIATSATVTGVSLIPQLTQYVQLAAAVIGLTIATITLYRMFRK